MRRDALQELKTMLGLQTEITGLVLVSPSTLGIETVEKTAKDLPMEDLAKVVGLYVADALANALETEGERPANYVNVLGVGKTLAKRLSEFLVSEEGLKVFDAAFVEQLKNRG